MSSEKYKSKIKMKEMKYEDWIANPLTIPSYKGVEG